MAVAERLAVAEMAGSPELVFRALTASAKEQRAERLVLQFA
jgi:hypothetical protein